MSFATLTFLIFLTLTFTLYWTMKKRMHQNILLLLASYGFYAWWDIRFCGIMFVSSLADFGIGLGMSHIEQRFQRRCLLLASLLVNLGLLGFFKYHNFFAENLNLILNRLGSRASVSVLNLVLPVGISFYTFQTLSYTIDVYRKRMKATHSLIEYMTFVSFFPQLVAGPIERASRLLPQFMNDRCFDASRIRDGLRRILWGLMKKMMLADNLGIIVDAIYTDIAAASGAQLALATVCFAFQIYCDFSAYSDIAIGTAQLFGIRLMRNFDYPYFSASMAEFWRRWHISLSTWFRDYVYIPLGGSRKSRCRVTLNVLLTFIISGLWHGAAWHFVFWGAIHGLAVVPSFLCRSQIKRTSVDIPVGDVLLPGPLTALRILGTFLITCLGWIFFRAESLADAFLILKKIAVDFLPLSIPPVLNRTGMVLFISLLIFLVIEWLQHGKEHPLMIENWPRAVRWGVYMILFWLTLSLSPPTGGEFIYFQF